VKCSSCWTAASTTPPFFIAGTTDVLTSSKFADLA
jgi:hypothetical protein